MVEIFLYTKDKKFENEIKDLLNTFDCEYTSTHNLNLLLTSPNNDSVLYIIDATKSNQIEDLSALIKDGAIILDDEKSKKRLKFNLVNILHKYELGSDDDASKNLILKTLENEKINHKSIGYKYLIDLIKLCHEDEKYYRQIHELSYKIIARKYNVSISSVERNIRTTLIKSKTDPETLKSKLTDILPYLD